MIERVHYSNYRALKDVRLELEPFTVLVGPNSSGKTSALVALDSSRAFQEETDAWRGSAPAVVTIRDADGTSIVRRKGSSGLPFPTALVHFELSQMRAARVVAPATALDRLGSNLVSVFATLPRATQSIVAEALSRLVPPIGDVHHRPGPANGSHRLIFRDRWQDSLWYEPDSVSDGTIYTLGYLVLQHQPERPRLICVEEPERSLHPYLLRHVVDLLRSFTTNASLGPPTQVIVATQSAELLEYVEPHEVRFLGRDDDGNVVVRSAPLDEPGWDEAVAEYAGSMGQMWLSGGLGGVPAE